MLRNKVPLKDQVTFEIQYNELKKIDEDFLDKEFSDGTLEEPKTVDRHLKQYFHVRKFQHALEERLKKTFHNSLEPVSYASV